MVPVTTLVSLPFTQVVFTTTGFLGATVGFAIGLATTEGFTTGSTVAEGVGVGVAVGVTTAPSTVPLNMTLIIGLEYVKLYALKESQPSLSFTKVVARLFAPLSEVTVIVAETGALVNP